MSWIVDWPASVDVDALDANQRTLAEMFAVKALRMLTLYRVGGGTVTVMPCARTCHKPNAHAIAASGSPFHPVLLTSGAYANCWCASGCSCASAPAVLLDTPVGIIESVVIDGATLPSTAYRVEDGNRLVRLDGEGWPACAGDAFTVTYHQSYPVDSMGRYAAGVLATEYLKLVGAERGKCRLPSSVTNVVRQGLTFEIARGMFPDGVTGLPEVDSFILQWNPHGLKTRPMVYSPDIKRARQINSGGI